MASSPISDTGQGGMVRPVDLDNDGIDDLAIGSANATTGGVRIRLATPNGAWSSKPTLAPGAKVGEIVAADFNGDADQDLLVHLRNPAEDLSQSDAYAFFRGHGDGTFGNAIPLSVSGEDVITTQFPGHSIFPIDLDGDGDLDLMFALTRGQIGIAESNGDGTFTGISPADIDGAPTGPGEGFSSVIRGDFDGNGSDDFAFGLAGNIAGAATALDSGLMVLYTGEQPAASDPVHLGLSGPFGPVFRQVAADLDHDGFDDLIVSTSPSPGSSTRLLAYEGGPNGLLPGPASLFTLPTAPPILLDDDFDGDGDLDLAWIESEGSGSRKNSLVLALGAADGGFLRQSRIFDLNFASNQGPPSFASTGDFNGDGAPDLATSFQSGNCGTNACGVSVLINRPTVALENDRIEFGVVKKGSTPAVKPFTITNHSGAPAELRSFVVTGTEPSVFRVNGQCQSIDPGASCTTTVAFATGKAGSFSSDLVYSFEGVSGDFRVHVTGTVVDHHGVFSPDRVAFGSLPVGAVSQPRKVTLTADGASGLTVGQLSLNGVDASQFALAGDTCSDQTLTTGQSCSFEVRANPSSIGAVSVTVEVPSNGEGTPQSIPLTATGTALTYEGSLKLAAPKKTRARKPFKVKATITNTGSGDLTGLRLRYRAILGKSIKGQGSVSLPTLAAGKRLAKKVIVNLKKRRLARGKPVKLTFTVLRQGKPLAARTVPIRLR